MIRTAVLCHLLAIALCAVASFEASAQAPRATGVENIEKQTPAQIKAGIEKKHPAAYYALAKKLFEQGEKDEAVFWFYAGQIRYRAYLMGNPQLPRDGDPALFASLSEVVGRPINVYAFGDIPTLVKTIDRALAWDAANPDSYSKAASREQARSGLVSMKEKVVATADEIRANRSKNGLENRAK